MSSADVTEFILVALEKVENFRGKLLNICRSVQIWPNLLEEDKCNRVRPWIRTRRDFGKTFLIFQLNGPEHISQSPTGFIVITFSRGDHFSGMPVRIKPDECSYICATH